LEGILKRFAKPKNVILLWFFLCHFLIAVDLLNKAIGSATFEDSDFYQMIFPFGIGAISLLLYLVKKPPYFPERIPKTLRFAVLFLLFALLEETACYLAGTGAFGHGRKPLAGYIIGTIGLTCWAIGVFIAFRYFWFSIFEICILTGLSGWILEGMVYHPLWKSMPLPIFFLILPPIVAFHYILLILYPITEIDNDMKTLKRSRSYLRYPVAVIAPLVLPGILANL
jgi:hypothetical protein